MGLCPLCGFLIRYFSFRPVIFIGSTLLCLGLLLSSFVNDVAVFYLTYGIIFGTGVCLLYMSAVIVLPFCFHNHLATATGLVIAANSGFTMCYGPLYEYLIRQYGWRATLRILSLFIIPLFVACAVFPNRKEVPRQTQKDGFDMRISFQRLMKSTGFVLWLFVMCLVYLGLFVPIVHLVRTCFKVIRISSTNWKGLESRQLVSRENKLLDVSN